jgi:7SK snRNA methylphosphate capping enzyme
LTIEIAKRYQPSFILGIDIDGDLITLAREQAKVKVGGETGSSKPTTLCMFKKEDFMEGDDHDGMESYDTICAFSITKWIHIHHGDEGIKRFFSKIYKLLSPGGTFILEPQLWRSYSKSAFRTVGDSGTVLKAIALKPALFSDYLTTTGGFSLVETITVTEGGIKNFKRPIYVFQKDKVV